MKVFSPGEILAKASDCLEDSLELLSGERYDAALNRAYYTMFHCIQSLLTSKNIVVKSHKGAHNAFHKEFILKRIWINVKKHL